MENNSNAIAEIQKKYAGCNLLMPAATEVQLNPFYKITVMEVTADLSENSGDIFKVGSVKTGTTQQGKDIWEETYSPAKPLLMKIAAAAGIQFDPDHTYGTKIDANSNKEVVTLDIFIEEYGKSVLPYLSKSGGEKVKASLSVILALAEIKSSTAGIQLGMLFIDEPPFLDSDGIQAYCDALETIQSRYPDLKIMAITHDPTMKARFPQSLDVVKTDEGSKVIY